MKITVLQTDIEWGAAVANRFRLEAMMASVGETDLMLLPEMFTTGFNMKPEGIAEPEEGETLQWMRRMAALYGCAVAGSIAVRLEQGSKGDAPAYVNRFYFVKPNGEEVHYDKHHLFTFAGEDRTYEAGDRRVVVEWKGLRWLLLVCYDVRFPAWIRYRDDYDGILLVANWPVRRIEAWDTLIRARAIENQCYLAAANRVGEDPACSYNGHSVILDAYGRTLATAPCVEESRVGDGLFASNTNLETALTAEVDLPSLTTFRHKFPVLEDRD